MLSTIPVGRAGNPEDVAAAVAFLASEEAGYITGQVLSVDAAWECEEERIRWKNAELLSPAWAPSTLWATISPRAGRLS